MNQNVTHYILSPLAVEPDYKKTKYILQIPPQFHEKSNMGPLFRSLVNLVMCQSAVNFSVRQNVVRNIFFLNIYNLGNVNPTEVRRISK